MEAPCKDCQDRVVGCHAACERYKQFDAWNKERLRKNAVQSELDSYRAGLIATARKKQKTFRRNYQHD